MNYGQHIIKAGLALLPENMDTPAARGMLYAIAMQESRFTHRRQIRGPARGFWQFEKIGVRGVLEHRASAHIVRPVLHQLRYPDDPDAIYLALENDILAVIFARLLLWRLPMALPGPDEAQEAWNQYIATWGPGRPHRATWDGFYKEAAALDWSK